MYEVIGKKNAINMRRLWTDESYRMNIIKHSKKPNNIARAMNNLNKLTKEQRKSAANNAKITLQSDIFKQRQQDLSLSRVNDCFKKKVSDGVCMAYNDPIKGARMRLRTPITEEQRQKISYKIRELWKSGLYREKWLEGMQRVSKDHNWISTQQKILYAVLEDLGLEFFREPDHIKELSFGCYRCDAIILATKPCLVMVNGDYWHRLIPSIVQKDYKFHKFFERSLKEKYNLLILWEHEFLAKNRIRDIVINTLNMRKEPILINKDDLILSIVDKNDGDLFLSKYHYMSKVGRGGIYNAILYNNKIIGIALFSPITRKESADRLMVLPHQILELTKLCLHPGYHSHNLASWFLAKSVSMLQKPELRFLITFADMGFGHTGVIYKAAGWKQDGQISPTYWYVDSDGHIIHKKTLYVHSRSVRMKESDFATKFGYKKIYTGPRLRFIKELHD